ncbi:Ycf1 protein (plastid) [Lotharella oceanica]|uniref:Ycf1 protein n=1 Tax=Lotharella oceanica TaxID=641309 RepID=A0A059SLW7_9EUKA|nr:Ycf1 protein [Lotharella oceanica]
MSYDSLIKDFIDGIYWNIDHLFNYLSFNSIKPVEINFIFNDKSNFIISNLKEHLGSFNINTCDFYYPNFNYQEYLSRNYPIYNYFNRNTLEFCFVNIKDYWFLFRENRFYLRFEYLEPKSIDQFFNVDSLDFDYFNFGIQEFLDLVYPTFNYKYFRNQDNFLEYLTYNYTYFFQYTPSHNYKSLILYKASQEISKLLYFYSPIFLSLNHFISDFIKGDWINNFSNVSLIHNEFIKSIINENLFFNVQSTGSLTILQLPTYLENKFFIGFLNSTFLALPFSCNQLLSFYTFLTRGPFLGFISTLGWISGQLSLFSCVLFGFKPIILQWYGLEPLNYFLGIYLIVVFLRESLDKIKKQESRALKPRKKYKKDISPEKLDLLMDELDNKDEKYEIKTGAKSNKEDARIKEIIRKRKKIKKLRIQREEKEIEKEKKNEKRQIKREKARLKRLKIHAIRARQKRIRERKIKKKFRNFKKSKLLESIGKKRRFKRKILLKRKKFNLIIKKKIFKLKRRKRQILQTTKKIFRITKKIIRNTTSGYKYLERKIKIRTKKIFLKSRPLELRKKIKHKYPKLDSKRKPTKLESDAKKIYDKNYRSALFRNARKIIKRKKLKRFLMNPKKLASRNENTDSKLKRIKPGKIFAFHFLLAWTENGYLFSYLNSLNFGTSSSVLNLSFVTNLNEYILVHLSYLVGLLFGCLFFSYLYNKAFIKFYFKIFKIRYMDKKLVKFLNKIRRLARKRRRKKERYDAKEFFTPLKTVRKKPKKLKNMPLKPTPALMRRLRRTKTLRLKKQKTFIDTDFIKEDSEEIELSGRRKFRQLRRFYRKFIQFTDTLANMNSIYFSKHAKYFRFEREENLKDRIEEEFQKYFKDEYNLLKTVFPENKNIVYIGGQRDTQKNKKKVPKAKKIYTIILVFLQSTKKIARFILSFLRQFFIKTVTKSLPNLLRSIPKTVINILNYFLKFIKRTFSFSTIKYIIKNIFNFFKEKQERTLSSPNLLETTLKKDTPIFIGRKLIIRRITTIIFTMIVGITMSSMSYYDVSYLLTRPLGFIPQDQRISRTIVNSNSDDVCEYGLSNDRDLYQIFDNNFLYSDIMSIDSKEYNNGLTFEQVNYQAEYSWASRSDAIKRTGFKYYQNDVRKQPKFRDNICISEKDIYLAELEYDEIEELLTKDFFEKNENIDPILARTYDPPKVFYEANPFDDSTRRERYEQIDTNFKIEFLPIDLDSYLFQWDEDDYLVDDEIGDEIRQNYYLNPIYKTLLNGEIDAFISRQPNELILSEFEENELFLRRKSLSNYYESNFYYSKMNHFDAFRSLFFDSKSALNTTYNQQFKGTLNIVQRLFPISLDNNNNRSVLKYDLPSLKKTNRDRFSHEELLNDGKNLSSNYKGLLTTTVSPLFIKWNNQLNQLVMTNNLILKETINSDIYEMSSPSKTNYTFNSFNTLNLQKFTSLIRNSYSIIQCPSLGILGSSPDSKTKIDYLLDKFDLPLDISTQGYLMKIGIQPNPDSKLLNSWLTRFNWYSFLYHDTLPFKDQTEEFGNDIEHVIKVLYYRDNMKGQQLEYKYKRGVNQYSKLRSFISDKTSKDKMDKRIDNYLIEDEKLNTLYGEDQLNILLFFGEIFNDYPT